MHKQMPQIYYRGGGKAQLQKLAKIDLEKSTIHQNKAEFMQKFTS